MKWEQLLSLRRFGDDQKRLRIDQDDTRLGFEVDYDRIVFSSSFRSLQDKTQVIPFSKTDFVHTRLTHSLEVSVVGRSIGRLAGKNILNKHPYLKQDLGYQMNDFGAIVAAASLAHDIGNPPFGHSGEKAIGYFFEHGEGKKYLEKLSGQEINDLINFEGNANGFRIATKSMQGIPGGLRLSYATLGAYTKYPKGSFPVIKSDNIAHKKFGFFKSEESFFKSVANDLGTHISGSYLRHPLAFLVEAADDICYTIIDFEDGINLGLISEDYALEYLINLVRETIDTKKYNKLTNRSHRLSYLRALSINTLIQDVVRVFNENESSILEGKFLTPLISKSKYKAQVEDIIGLSVEKIYKSDEVANKEVVGYKVIDSLLKPFVSASVNSLNNSTSSYDKSILRLVPDGTPMVGENLYDTLLNATCFVASLSDGKANELSKQIH
ncbi:MAG: dGTPase [Flavobacteriaceae bacterium]|nr:dGTPase [Flavobacteriaceae bacterium]|tara:strand:- start:298 stop:1614 length:1317 start_codon:yes stop_codon:yes gene_type:complete